MLLNTLETTETVKEPSLLPNRTEVIEPLFFENEIQAVMFEEIHQKKSERPIVSVSIQNLADAILKQDKELQDFYRLNHKNPFAGVSI